MRPNYVRKFQMPANADASERQVSVDGKISPKFPASTSRFSAKVFPNSFLEVFDDEKLVGSLKIGDELPEDGTVIPYEQTSNAAVSPGSGDGTQEKNLDELQQVVPGSDGDGETVPRPVELPTPPVAEGDARLGCDVERGPEVSPDGLLDSGDAPDVL